MYKDNFLYETEADANNELFTNLNQDIFSVLNIMFITKKGEERES